MDSFTIEEVKNLVKSNLISENILNNILDSTIRKIELYNDDDSIEILKYLKEIEIVPISFKKEIELFLSKHEKRTEYLEQLEDESNNKQYVIYIVTGIISIITGIFILFIKRG